MSWFPTAVEKLMEGNSALMLPSYWHKNVLTKKVKMGEKPSVRLLDVSKIKTVQVCFLVGSTINFCWLNML